jgi:hypothetical protein
VEFVKAGHTKATQARVAEDITRISQKTTFDRQIDDFVVDLESPVFAIRRTYSAEAPMRHQVRRSLRNTELSEIFGRCTQYGGCSPYPLDLIATYLIQHHPDSEVDAVSQEFNIGRCYAELYLEVRMLLEKIWKGRRKNAACERWRRNDAKTAAELSRTEVVFDYVIEPYRSRGVQSSGEKWAIWRRMS